MKVSHDRLVDKAANFLKYQKNCRIVLKEHVAATVCGETPDVIGWKNRNSYLIECKASRSDFFADKKKKFRKFADNSGYFHRFGMGKFRYYFVPQGLVTPEEVPGNWGLVYLDGRSYNEIITCDHSLYDNPTVINRENPVRFNKLSPEAYENEIAMLISACANSADTSIS